MPSIKRNFLGWDRPCLELAAKWLIEHYASASIADMSRLSLVLPVSRAGRRLIETLVELSEKERITFIPPKVVSLGALPELLYDSEVKTASLLESNLAWLAALRSSKHFELENLFPKSIQESEFTFQSQIVEHIHRIWQEISAAGLKFQDVAEKANQLLDETESARWN